MQILIKSIVASIITLMFSAIALAQTPSNDGTEVYFISPVDGDVITGPVTIRFGLKGMGVAPAGVENEGTGHHHLVINAGLPPFDENIPMDENYRHFGGGQTEVTLNLEPGQHTLQLLLGDMYHIPHVPAVHSKQITITVTE